jgi:predicted secreted Zn-dependent protease
VVPLFVFRKEIDMTGPFPLTWKKSTFSMGNGDCVEAADLEKAGVALRDSKDQTGPVLMFTPSEWQAFISGVKAGEFDFHH